MGSCDTVCRRGGRGFTNSVFYQVAHPGKVDGINFALLTRARNYVRIPRVRAICAVKCRTRKPDISAKNYYYNADYFCRLLSVWVVG